MMPGGRTLDSGLRGMDSGLRGMLTFWGRRSSDTPSFAIKADNDKFRAFFACSHQSCKLVRLQAFDFLSDSDGLTINSLFRMYC